MGNQLGYEVEAFVGTMRRGWKAEVDQRELRCAIELAKQAFGLGTGFSHIDPEVAFQHVRERIRDERIVIDDEQLRFFLIRQNRSPTVVRRRLFCQQDLPHLSGK